VEITSALHREQHRKGLRGSMGKRGMDALARVPLFQGLSRRHLRRLSDIAEEVRFGANEPIVEEGMLGETFYAILEGEARVLRQGRTINRLYPGDFFGEVSLVDGGPRTASVIASTRLVAARLYRHRFLRLLTTEPQIALKIMTELARRIRGSRRTLIS